MDLSAGDKSTEGTHRPLTELATLHETDKWNGHWYAQHYDRQFAAFRERPVRLLEIGIGGYHDPKAGGQSLRMWRDYFPSGLIVGLDIFDKSPHREDRIRTVKGSQVDEQVLSRVIADYGPFDLIIDDGSHQCAHVVRSFEFLFERGLVDGGIYAAEDLQTSYWPATGGSLDLDSTKTSIGYFKRLCDRLNWPEWHRPGYRPSFLDTHVASVHFYHNLVFVHRALVTERSTMVQDNNVPLGLRRPLAARARSALKKTVVGAVELGSQLLLRRK